MMHEESILVERCSLSETGTSKSLALGLSLAAKSAIHSASSQQSYRFLQCFFDVGRFAHRTLIEWQDLEKTGVSDSKIEARGFPGKLGRAGSNAKTAKAGEKARSKRRRGLRKYFCQRERSNFERESTSCAPEERAGLRRSRGVFSEFSNG